MYILKPCQQNENLLTKIGYYMALGLKIAVLMCFNADIFVQKALRESILCI